MSLATEPGTQGLGPAPSMPQSSESISLYRQCSQPLECHDYKCQILECMTKRLASAPSDFIQRRKKAILNELRDTKLRAENIFQSDQPLAMFLTAGRKPAFLILLSCLIFFLEFAVAMLTANQIWSVSEFQHFRFVPLALRDGGVPTEPGIFDFHMLGNGCMKTEGVMERQVVNNTLVKSYPAKIRVNGFAILAEEVEGESEQCTGAPPGGDRKSVV